MAMTASVKDELSRVPVSRMSARKAELATMLRFAGALHLIGGHIVIEAELDTGSVARRLRKEIADIFGHGSEVQIVAGALVLAGVALGFGVHPAFFGLSAFVGAGLAFAGLTGFCGMARVLALAPWNRLARG